MLQESIQVVPKVPQTLMISIESPIQSCVEITHSLERKFTFQMFVHTVYVWNIHPAVSRSGIAVFSLAVMLFLSVLWKPHCAVEP